MFGMSVQFLDLLEYLGTYAFAVSGIRFAAAQRFDWFGAYTVGFATAIGGGTIRDVLLSQTPFWMSAPSYLICTAVALFSVILLRPWVSRLSRTLLLFDAVGLSLFTIIGIQKTLSCGFPFWTAILMGVLTGCAGGVLRDVLTGNLPVIFRREIYAVASLIGGVLLYVLYRLGLPAVVSELLAAAAILLIRVVAVSRGLSLPRLSAEPHDEEA